MQLRNYIDPARIFPGLAPADKSALLEELAAAAAANLDGIEAQEVLHLLQEREADSSTAVGQGIAIPHSFTAGLADTVCILAQVPAGIDYDTPDGLPVRFLFMLLSPPNNQMKHLRLLARISRVAGRQGFADDAARAKDAAAIHALIVAEDESHVD